MGIGGRGSNRVFAAAGLVLAGCIPQVDPPFRGAPPERRQDRPARAAAEAPGRRTPPVPAARPRDPREPEVKALPAPRPPWEARAIAPDAAEVEASVVVVGAGDTLSRVAERTGAGADAIARENGLVPPFVVRPGQRLRIPAGRYHLVRQGQSGIGIARAYGVEWSRIVAANGLADPFILRVGQRVIVPRSTDSGRSVTAERAAAFRLDIDDILTGGEPALATNQAPATPIATPRRVLPASAAVVAPLRPLLGGFGWPVQGRIVTRFGPGRSGERSNGIKIAVPEDTPVLAAADGVVAYVGDGIAALGGLVIVKHGDGWTSVYGHAAKLLVRRGQSVKRGQTVALSGDSGYAERPEVHFELRRGRTPVDPITQLPRL